MRVYDKHYRQVAVFVVVAILVIGVGVSLWDRITNQHQQAITAPNQPPREIPPSSNEVPLEETSQSIPEPNSNLFSNGQLDSTVAEMTTTSAEAIENQAASIKAWMKLLEENSDEDSVRRFIELLTDDEVLELMEYFCNNDQLSAVEGLLIPALKKKWEKGVPFEKLLDIVITKERNYTFRTILVNFTTVYGRQAELEMRDKIASRLMQIVGDQGGNGDFRTSVIMYLSSLLPSGVSNQVRYAEEFLNILNDPSEHPTVVGATITTLRRLENVEALPFLVDTCMDVRKVTSPDIMRHAVVALAKYSLKQNVQSPLEPIRTVLTSTQDSRVYGSSVYALSLLTTNEFQDVLPDIMASLSKHAGQKTSMDAILSALHKQKKAILLSLNSDRPDSVVAGIKACSIAYVPEAANLLRSLEGEYPENNAIIAAALKKSDQGKDGEPSWRRELIEEKQNVD